MDGLPGKSHLDSLGIRWVSNSEVGACQEMRTMRNLWKIFFVLIFLVINMSCGASNSQIDRDLQEASIYSLLLNQDPVGYIIGTPIVILDETQYYEIENMEAVKREFPAMEMETINDYEAANQKPQTVTISLNLNKPYDFVSNSDLDNLIEKYDIWDKFNHKYPGTHVYTFFSRVGFNNKGNQALVYMAHSCGGECGKGNLYFLTFDGSKWKIDGISIIWVS